ncbi:hypothetical protein [Nocardia sp. NPDC059239]|uniref:hypothetical protein n=1 Tax=unclassified Nocardia TaxID=2637762 RepID=UPI003682A7A2
MKSYDEYEKTARDERAFSNGTVRDIWSHSVCLGGGNPKRRCVNDDDADIGNGCPLILLSTIGKTPAEWTGKRAQYRCTEHTTAAQARAAEDEALAQKIADSHYPMFPEGVV